MNEPGFDDVEAVRRPPRFKMWLGVGLALVLLVAWYGFVYATRDTQKVPPRLIGSVWTASVDGAARVYFVTKEDRAVVRSFDPEGTYTYNHTYSIYTLHARDPKSGAAAATTQIARIETTSVDFKKYRAYVTLPDGPGILGPQADVLWLWNKGLEARDLRTLATVWTSNQLKECNPEFASLMPDDPKYTRVLGKLKALVFKGQDARFFKIDRASGRLEPVDESALARLSPEHTKTADSAFTGLNSDGRSLRHTSLGEYVRNSILIEGSWFALLTAAERAQLRSYLGALEERYYVNSSLRESSSLLFRGRYKLQPERNFPRTSIQLDLESVVPVSQERFLMAGFLRRPNTYDAWAVGGAPAQEKPRPSAKDALSPHSHLVLHRKALGDKSPWFLTRLSLDGTVHWTRSTGLVQLDQLCDGQGAVVLTGYAESSMPIGERPDRMFFMDEITGNAQTLNVASGEMTPASEPNSAK